MNPDVMVVGAGLAGSEAAWQLAEKGFRVALVEMRPSRSTPAHQTGSAAEMVCSNSFKSDDPLSATGILKAELRQLQSLILQAAAATCVPAGMSLAVDRTQFSLRVTSALRNHPLITWHELECISLDLQCPTILATGPLTSPAMEAWLGNICGSPRLHFYDAIAPIVERASIDEQVAFRASRYDKGSPDFFNCPLNKDEYTTFLEALLSAPRAPLHDFETTFFEACLPIEVMAERGPDTLRFGPMKPVGLTDPRTGRWPYAAVQLRQDTLAGDLFNLVGFQTRLTWPAQAQVLRLIPGLRDAIFARFGSIHRNTYVNAPEVLDETSAVKHIPNLWIAGQLSGVEGYLESAASGLAVAQFVTRHIQGRVPRPLPPTTMLGALLSYLAHSPADRFSPINAMLGILPPLPEDTLDIRTWKRTGGAKGVKQAKGALHRARSMSALQTWLSEQD